MNRYLLHACLAVFSLLMVSGCASDPIMKKRVKHFVDYIEAYQNCKEKEALEPPFIMFLGRGYINSWCTMDVCTNIDGLPPAIRSGLSRKLGHFWLEGKKIRSVLDIYKSEALGIENLFEKGVLETNSFTKIKRVALPAKAIGDHRGMLDQEKTLLGISIGLFKEMIKCGGDAVMDICLHTKGYQQIGDKQTATRRSSLSPMKETRTTTATTYKASFIVTATIIKFKDGFRPDEKFLLFKQNVPWH